MSKFLYSIALTDLKYSRLFNDMHLLVELPASWLIVRGNSLSVSDCKSWFSMSSSISLTKARIMKEINDISNCIIESIFKKYQDTKISVQTKMLNVE